MSLLKDINKVLLRYRDNNTFASVASVQTCIIKMMAKFSKKEFIWAVMVKLACEL